MAVGRTNASAAKGGGGIDYSTKPQITFDGKWSDWYIEFYAGVPYWEAVFYSSGTLNVSGSYTADKWSIGGGAYSQNVVCGNGAVVTALGLSLIAKSYAITVGAGGNTNSDTTYPGGATSSTIAGDLQAAGGQPNKTNTGAYYRFGDAGHANEAGTDGEAQYESHGIKGWLHWRCDSSYFGDGTGYGAGGCFTGVYRPMVCGHPGVTIIRIAI